MIDTFFWQFDVEWWSTMLKKYKIFIEIKCLSRFFNNSHFWLLKIERSSISIIVDLTTCTEFIRTSKILYSSVSFRTVCFFICRNDFILDDFFCLFFEFGEIKRSFTQSLSNEKKSLRINHTDYNMSHLLYILNSWTDTNSHIFRNYPFEILTHLLILRSMMEQQVFPMKIRRNVKKEKKLRLS